jgi:hypothetical protein
MKGLSAPLALYELRALRGRYAQPGAPPAPEPEVSVSLPLACWVIEGKIVSPETIAGEVRRLGRRDVVARLDAPLPALANLRLRLEYPAPGGASRDIYGKVTAGAAADPERFTRIRITSLTDEDAAALEALVGAGGATPGAAANKPRAAAPRPGAAAPTEDSR